MPVIMFTTDMGHLLNMMDEQYLANKTVHSTNIVVAIVCRPT